MQDTERMEQKSKNVSPLWPFDLSFKASVGQPGAEDHTPCRHSARCAL